MSKPTVSYATFCCPKDRERALENVKAHAASHGYDFMEKIMVFQRCEYKQIPYFYSLHIREQEYPSILNGVGVKYPDEVLSELTHGWGAPHYFGHHICNHVVASKHASGDYLVFADADCYVKDQPAGSSWIDLGIKILESDPSVFVVSPSDGRPNPGKDRMMSQQMFLINRKRFLEMEYIPWDGKFIEGGPFQEFYGLWEGFCYRYMVKHNLYRYLLPKEISRWWHLEWH